MRAIKVLALTAALVALTLSVTSGSGGVERTAGGVGAQARQILANAPLVDGHIDLPDTVRRRFAGHLGRIDLETDTSQLDPPMHIDIPRLRRGAVGAIFLSAYVSTNIEATAAVPRLFESIDLVGRLAAAYPQHFVPATTAADVEAAHRAGRIALLIGIEGGHAIANSLGVLRQAYACGARYLTLTHSRTTAWADSATDSPRHDGLSAFGAQVIREMNRLGMLVDLSHASDATMRDAITLSTAPVIFSHSSARALCGHARNVPDDVLRELAVHRGVVMVTFVPSFVSEATRRGTEDQEAQRKLLREQFAGDEGKVEPEVAAWRATHPVPAATLAQVADHIDHIRRIAGIDCIGIGSDFEGISSTPVGLEDVSRFPDLLGELLRRGYAPREVAKVAGGNVLRVMREAEATAVRLQREQRPSEARIEEVDGAPQTTPPLP